MTDTEETPRIRRMTLSLTVDVPVTTGENEVETAINAALDEPPCDWGTWFVGAVEITAVSVVEVDG